MKGFSGWRVGRQFFVVGTAYRCRNTCILCSLYLTTLLDTVLLALQWAQGPCSWHQFFRLTSDFLRWVTGFIFGGGTGSYDTGGTALTRIASPNWRPVQGTLLWQPVSMPLPSGLHFHLFYSFCLLGPVFVILAVTFIFVKFGKKNIQSRSRSVWETFNLWGRHDTVLVIINNDTHS